MKRRDFPVSDASGVQFRILTVVNNQRILNSELKLYTVTRCNNLYWYFNGEYAVSVEPRNWFLDYGKIRKKLIYSNDAFVKNTLAVTGEIIAYPVQELVVNGVTYVKFKGEDLKTECWVNQAIFKSFKRRFEQTKIASTNERNVLILPAKKRLLGWIEQPPIDILRALNKGITKN